MPERATRARAQRDKREGKAATTQAGEYVREEMEHAKEGKHPVKSRKQAIAIGLSKARREGVKIPDRRGRKSKSRTSSRTSGSSGRRTKSSGGRGGSARRTQSRKSRS